MAMNDKMIYLDNAATTAMHPQVLEKMVAYFCENYGNASSVYRFAQKSKQAQEEARRVIAETLHAEPSEIYFTAGGSEADNWALKGAAESYRIRNKEGGHIITSQIEHHAVLHTCEYLERQGFAVTYLGVDEDGLVDITKLKESIRSDTFLVSIMFANNEIGTIQPIKEIGAVCREQGIWFHTDAVQAYGHLPIDVEECNIDMLSASGHKFHGPKGVGFLYIRKQLRMYSFIHGGEQERGRRAGTSNVPGIVGMGEAAKLAYEKLNENMKNVTELRAYLIEKIEKDIPSVRLNGHREKRLPNNVSFCFRFIEGESLLIMLDMQNICASSGSACTSGSLDPSHVLLAIGLPHEIAHGSLRLTLSEETTREELDYTVDKIKEIVERLRSISPLYEDFLAEEKGAKHV